jgi:hypothetical protein
MSGYWGVVFKRAWTDTKQSFGWNQKTAATTLIAGGGLVAAFFHLGLLAMIASAEGIAWTALPFVLAGLLLFAWNFMAAQSRLYYEAVAKCNDLEMALSNAKEPPPNYEAWRHRENLTLWQAAFLWSDLEPRLTMSPKARPWLQGLMGAIQKGELQFVPEEQMGPPSLRDTVIQLQRKNPGSDTVVTRQQLLAFAKLHGYDPIFLRGS